MEADDFQNLITSLSTNTSGWYNFQEDPFSSFYEKLLTDKQTVRKTNAGLILHNLLVGGNKIR